MKTIFSDLLNLIFPKTCLVCDARLLDDEKHICLKCLLELPRTGYYKKENNPLELLFAGRLPFVHSASFAYFNKGGGMQKLIHSLKYKANSQLGVYLGELCGRELKASAFIQEIDYLVPVPIHPKRERIRGYNQSLMIVQGISKQTGIPINSGNLIRAINNPSQTKQSRFARWTNVEGIFSLNDPSVFEGKHILLVDDIVTTGSTTEACVKTILQSENVRISIYVIASTI